MINLIYLIDECKFYLDLSLRNESWISSAKTIPYSTSRILCCFVNRVEPMISIEIISQTGRYLGTARHRAIKHRIV